MSNKKVSVKTCLLLCILCILGTSTVFGTPTMKEIVAYLNYSIDFVVDGEVKELYDAEGNRVYPISYNGTTYIPVRGIGTVLGADVSWDSENGNVVITTKKENEKTVEKVDMLKGLDKKTDLSYIIKNDADKIIKVNEKEIKFTNGLFCKMLSNQDFQIKDFVSIPVNKDIKEVSFDGFASKNSSVNVFNQQGKLIKTFYLQPNKVTTFSCTVDTSVTTDLYFVSVSQSDTVSENDYVKIFNLYGSK